MLCLSTAVAGLLLALPPTQAATGQASSALAAEYEKLESEFQRAQEEYYAPLQNAKTAEERESVRLDPAREPAHLYVPRFQDLARRAKGDDVGARALLWIVQNHQGAQVETLESVVDELVTGYASSPRLVLLPQLFEWGPPIDTPRALDVLDRVAKASPHADVRAACLFVSGVLRRHDAPGSAAAARELFLRVTKEYAGSPWAERADAFLFEMDHLQVGMVAPDFQASDEKDAAFKLSDFRGKVVVLDFWGFW